MTLKSQGVNILCLGDLADNKSLATHALKKEKKNNLIPHESINLNKSTDIYHTV